MHFGGAPSLRQPLPTLVVLRSSVNSKPFHVNYNNANLKTGARWCNYSSICSYCRGSCLPGRNITLTVCFRFLANLSWLDAFTAPFQGLEFSLSNFLLNSQLQRVDLGSTFDNLETCFSGLVWSASSLDRTYRKKNLATGLGSVSRKSR